MRRPAGCAAIVLSDRELPSCAALMAAAVKDGAIAAVTAEAAPTRLLLPEDVGIVVPVPPLVGPM